MKKFLFVFLLVFPIVLQAQNWDLIRQSGDYYYGEGQGKTKEEAMKNAQAELTSMIATHVSSDFQSLDEGSVNGGEEKHQSLVLSCLNTYTQATLTNLKYWPIETKTGYIVRCYMKRSELARIYDGRIERVKTMVKRADGFLQKRKLDLALQYYYWAYSLVRSLQFPNEVKNEDGEILVDVIPSIIEDILTDIEVCYVNQLDDCVNLKFTYQGQPISSLGYLYNDGHSNDTEGLVKNGNGSMWMASGHEQDKVFHLRVDYEYKQYARGDNEVMSVMNVITPKVFSGTSHKVTNPGNGKAVAKAEESVPTSTAATASVSASVQTPATNPTAFDYKLDADKSQIVEENEEYAYATIMTKVVEAARTGNYSTLDRYFTLDGGLPRYRELLRKGGARIVGNPNIQFFKGRDGQVVARGLQLSLTYTSRGRKQTFVEDVAFTFDREKRIDNVTFGLGHVAENDILCKHPGWSNEAKETLMEFLENYKTAYCMKDIDYISNIFADDAVIIVGSVVRKAATNNNGQERPISVEGQEIIQYNRYTKDEFLKNLRRCFDRNEFINLRFSQNEIQHLEKFKDRDLYGIQIGQDYASSTYSDQGYLFLLVDLTNRDLPQIKIRTWQPHQEKWENLYHAGDFYDF